MKGKVYLVGAGPGDGDMITLKGRRLLQEADVVVYDRLVGSEIMDMIPTGCRRIDVGKNAGSHPTPQGRINQILLEEAEKGQVVVRLKGGDPFVFGRGGEELELLADKAVDFEVVPGITSSIAAPAYAGIPVTHRDFCSSLHIITGHARAGGELKIDFDALVRLRGTLIFMMSVSSAGQLAKGLLEAGMDPREPCAIIENGTLPWQRKFVGSLSEMEDMVLDNQVRSPAVIMVGKVADLSDRFDWFSRRPLFGKKVLVTQPEGRSSRMAEGLKRLGAQVTLRPTIRTAPIRPLQVPDEDRDTLVFTSAQGVYSYMEWLLEVGRDARHLAGKKIACIGSATAAALKEYGIRADFVPSEYSGKALGEEMVQKGFVDKDSKVLLLRTAIASRDVMEVLDREQIDYLDLPVYDTELIQYPEEEAPENFDMVTFTSRSCVRGFVESAGDRDYSGVRALCIGRQTAEEAATRGFDVVVSEEATIESMLEKAAEML